MGGRECQGRGYKYCGQLFNHSKDATLRARGIVLQISLVLFENTDASTCYGHGGPEGEMWPLWGPIGLSSQLSRQAALSVPGGVCTWLTIMAFSL